MRVLFVPQKGLQKGNIVLVLTLQKVYTQHKVSYSGKIYMFQERTPTQRLIFSLKPNRSDLRAILTM
jgi:hypothetical protein